jgi:hypothetical protein
VQPLWKSVRRFLKKLKIELSYVLAIPLLGIYLKESKTAYNRDTCMPIFIEQLRRIKSCHLQEDGWNERSSC